MMATMEACMNPSRVPPVVRMKFRPLWPCPKTYSGLALAQISATSTVETLSEGAPSLNDEEKRQVAEEPSATAASSTTADDIAESEVVLLQVRLSYFL